MNPVPYLRHEKCFLLRIKNPRSWHFGDFCILMEYILFLLTTIINFSFEKINFINYQIQYKLDSIRPRCPGRICIRNKTEHDR